jgi:hypothetical protein
MQDYPAPLCIRWRLREEQLLWVDGCGRGGKGTGESKRKMMLISESRRGVDVN